MRAALVWTGLAVVGCSQDIQVANSGNAAPLASINGPEDGAAFLTNELIDFIGTVSDDNGLEDIQTVLWTSSIDGELASADLAQPDTEGVSRISATLSVGVHAITFRATDLSGSVGESSIQVNVTGNPQLA